MNPSSPSSTQSFEVLLEQKSENLRNIYIIQSNYYKCRHAVYVVLENDLHFWRVTPNSTIVSDPNISYSGSGINPYFLWGFHSQTGCGLSDISLVPEIQTNLVEQGTGLIGSIFTSAEKQRHKTIKTKYNILPCPNMTPGRQVKVYVSRNCKQYKLDILELIILREAVLKQWPLYNTDWMGMAVQPSSNWGISNCTNNKKHRRAQSPSALFTVLYYKIKDKDYPHNPK